MLRSLGLSIGALGLFAACGSPPAPVEPRVHRVTPRPAPSALAANVPALHSTLITKVPDGTFGPYVGQGRDDSLVAWAAAEGEQRGWYVVPVSPAGALRGAPKRIADAPPEVGVVVVRGRADGPGFTVVSTRRTALSEWVEVMFVGENGQLLAGPRPLAEVRGSALWVEVVPMGERRLVLWAQPKDQLADIDGVVLNARGEPEADAALFASGMKAWQAVAFGGGAALGTVSGDGRVAVTFVEGRDGAKSRPLVVSSAGHAQEDFDLALIDKSLLVAWSDGRDGDNRVYRSVIGPDRAITVPEAPLTPPLGEQALVRAVSRPGATRAWVAWESPAARAGEARAFDVTSVDAGGHVSPERGRVELESDDAAVPEFAALADGVAALTLASECPRQGDCDDGDVMPTFVRFGPKLEVLASEPLRLEGLDGAPAELGWELSCREKLCFALAALGDAPAPVLLAALERRSDSWRPAGRQITAEAPPRIRENRVLAKTDPLSDLALTKVGQGSLAAYLTDFDPGTPWVKLKHAAPDGRLEPLRAKLALIGLRADGTLLAPEQPLSLRAHSLGGVTLSPGAPGTPVLAAWTGLDAGQPQVFLTLVGPDGTHRSQRMLTHKSGDSTDVAATAVGKGWLVAWVDERDHDPEVYATRVDDKLSRIGNEHRLTSAPGPATQVALAALGETAVVAWADARNPSEPGEADIFVERVATRDATPIGGEKRVLATRGHSFAPALARFGTGLVLVWLERGSPDAPDSAGIMLQDLDAAGELVGEARRLALAEGEPAALALDCVADTCHLVVGARAGDDAMLLASSFRKRGEPVPLKRVASLGSRSAAGIPLALAGEELLYADMNDDGAWRVRRALLDWP
ncbi:MAG TPA: hypothetical protein VLJ38_07785 [Polyangiaceae bacterium]|nr:hypothetical protein [Polyangiaceae bacterium]